MKKSYGVVIIVFLLIVIFFGSAMAESRYVTDITKITMRSAPDTEHQIIMMLKSGTRVDILEQSGQWSKVRTKNGQEGWSLSRFLVSKKPAIVLLGSLVRQNKKISDQLVSLKLENAKLLDANQKFIGIEEKYNELEAKSKVFLELDKKYKDIKKKYDAQQAIIVSFEDSYRHDIKIWFIIGAVVLIVGILFGMGSKKHRRSYLR